MPADSFGGTNPFRSTLARRPGCGLFACEGFYGKRENPENGGGFHGLYDGATISVHPHLEKAGNPARPVSVPMIKVSSPYCSGTVVAPFNDKEATQAIFQEHLKSLAQ